MAEAFKCPNCGWNCEADYVDIGVGEQRTSPWRCANCGWVDDDASDLIDLSEIPEADEDWFADARLVRPGEGR